MFAEGEALARLERVLIAHELAELRNAVTDDLVPAGTLLWQGSDLGFCILNQSTNRRSGSGQSVPLLTLRSKKRDAKLMPSFLLPSRSLLGIAETHASGGFTKAHAEVLTGFANRLEWAIKSSQ